MDPLLSEPRSVKLNLFITTTSRFLPSDSWTIRERKEDFILLLSFHKNKNFLFGDSYFSCPFVSWYFRFKSFDLSSTYSSLPDSSEYFRLRIWSSVQFWVVLNVVPSGVVHFLTTTILFFVFLTDFQLNSSSICGSRGMTLQSVDGEDVGRLLTFKQDTSLFRSLRCTTLCGPCQLPSPLIWLLSSKFSCKCTTCNFITFPGGS